MRKQIITTLGFTFFGLFILINGLISQALADEIKIKIPISTLNVSKDNEGNAKYSGENVQYLAQSGQPMIPYQVIKVLLPPDADLNTVSGTIDNIKIEELAGEWEVRSRPPEATWDGKKVITVWPKGKTIVNGYDINIYEKNVLFPENLIGKITAGQTRRWRMVDIPIAMYRFNPVAKKLLRLVEGELIVEFSIDPTAISILKERTVIPDRIGEDSAKKLTANFNEVSPAYEEIFPQALTSQQISRYVIITTNNIKFGSNELQNFVSSKVMRGFTVEVVTEDVWGGGTGDTAAENIRDWLSNNYENKNIEYVLLIGNPDPNSGDVPMKMLWPRSDAETYRNSPSDYYYADLTGNWDLDNDDLYGEREDDFGTGGVDRNWDVLVGRIPYYGNMNDLDAILAKIIAYENETSNEAVWRQNVLLPMKPMDSDTPSYHLGEAIKDDTITYKGNWDYHRVYDEDYGLVPPPENYPCTYDNVTDAWNSSKFGAIFWWTHGSSTSASQIMDLSHAATLDNSYPGFTFQGSCHNSYPENTDNLSYSLLKNGCIGTIGATRVSWYWIGETYFIGSTSNSGMTYEYSKRLIENELDSGHALYEMKQVLVPGSWMNFTVFNIYGDPSTGLFTSTELIAKDLLYTPVTPCRIADTRMAGGMISVNTQRDFHVYGDGATISAQGGSSAGCSAPLGEPLAAHINLVVSNPTGKGNMQAYPVKGTQGANLIVNFANIGSNLANAGIVETTLGAGPDIRVMSRNSSAHAVIDVLGYYYTDGDLLFTPVTPCRIADTRISGGIIGANTQRNFHVHGNGGTISAQGGNPAGCSAPIGEPFAVHINMTAANPTGKGYMQAFAVGDNPGANFGINFAAIGSNFANAGIVESDLGLGPEITVTAQISSAHAVIDVLGYYYQYGDFSYTPVTPCRIVDTRKTLEGKIGASTERDFHVFGDSATINTQGGNSDGCPAPSAEPLAAHINLAAVNPTGKGNMQAYPLGNGPGANLAVNFADIGTSFANAGTVQAATGSGPEITVTSRVSSTHAVIDVLGYYYPDP